MGPGALWHRGALRSSSQRRDVWHTSVQLQNRYDTWPLRLDPADKLKLSATQRGVSSCLTSPCDVTLQSKVECLSRWRHAPLQEWPTDFCPHSCGLLSAFLPAARCLGRSAIPARREACASQPLQVQQREMLRLIY